MFLPDSVQQELRAINKIQANEVLKKEGDLFVAVNVVNQQRRIVNIEKDLLERLNRSVGRTIKSEKKILRG